VITIEFDHRLEEHLRAARLYYAKRSWFARGDKIAAVIFAVYGLAASALVGIRWWTVIWLVLAPLEWFNLLSIQPLVVRYVFKRSKKFHEHTTLSFSAEHIHYQTPSIDSTLAWSLFADIVEDDQLFVLPYKAPRSYAIVPKRAFASEADRAQFRELARRQIAQAAA
jgi:hypothetical protein